MRYRYRTDDELKDSGVDWLGKIPRDWEMKHLKYIIKNNDGGTWGEEQKYNDDDIIVIRSTEVDEDGKWRIDNPAIRNINQKEKQRCILLKGDLLITKSSGSEKHIGKTAIVTSEIENMKCVFSNFMQRIKVKSGNSSKLLFYIMNSNISKLQINYLSTTTTGLVNINGELINRIKIPTTTLFEQEKIANFLDEKTSQFDLIISKKEKLIERLEEAKKSLISEVVTGKVKVVKTNDGYELVKRSSEEMKDSGVEWVKEIPTHWEVINGKWLFSQRKDKAKPDDEQLTASQKYGVIFQKDFMELENQKVVLVEKDFSILKHVEPNDFVISMRSFQGGLEYSQLRGCISSAYVMLIPNEKVYSPFFRWFFKSAKYINALQSTSNLVRDGQAMRYSNFIQIPLFIFSKEEQEELANYLDKYIYNIDNLISKTQNQINKLKEAKQSLISEVVTGKIEILD